MLWAVFLASLVGSVHCAAMCGPLAAAAEGGGAPGRRRAAWHGGRLLVYLGLGAGAGAAGGLLDVTAATLGWPAVAARAAGWLLVLAGVIGLLRVLGVRLGRPGDPAIGLLRRAAGLAASLPAGRRAFALGAASALLPCGWLYAFVAVAGGTASAAGGAAALAVFWLGTVPAVAAAAAVLQRLAGPLRRRLPAFGALALIVIGLLTALGRGGAAHAHPPTPAPGPPRDAPHR